MVQTRISVTREIAKPALDRLKAYGELTVWKEQDPPPYERLVEMTAGSHGLLCLLTDRIDESLLAAAPNLRVVSTMSVGYEHIDLQACKNRGIKVGNTPGVLTDATADFTMAMILCLARRIPEAADFARSGLWHTWGPGLFLGPDFGGAKIGIVGAGRIGQAVAHRAHSFGSQILYHDRVRRIEIEQELEAQALSFKDLLAQADIVTLHVPLTDQTHHLISHDEFGMMKPTALLINTSRGPIVHTEALLEALREGTITAVGLDVTDPEPLPASHPLYELENCLITPHIASAGTTTRTRMAQMAVDNLIAGLKGATLPHSVV